MTLTEFLATKLDFAWVEVDGKPLYVKRVGSMLEVAEVAKPPRPRPPSPFGALAVTEVHRALGGRPNDFTEEEVQKLPSRAQEQLYRALRKLREDADAPLTGARLMREVARGRVSLPDGVAQSKKPL